MKARLKCEKPEDIEYTVVLTATAKEFEELRDQLIDTWPSSDLVRTLNDLLGQARKIYWPTVEE